MSLQSELDQEAIDMLPKIKTEIKKAASFEANEMLCRTLRECMNSKIAMNSMNSEQLEKFQQDLLEIFEYNNWIRK